MELSPLLKIMVVFASLLALTRLKIHLGVSLVLGGLILGFWAGHGPEQVFSDLTSALLQSELWLLLLITALILEFGRHMAEKENAEVIMSAARAWGGRHGHAASLMAIPAAIGVVPMPGGALFSAPLVDQVTGEVPADASWKSAVNYWFRHTWEYWWPLYPVVIVSLSIFTMEMGTFILMQIPMSIATLVGGYILLIRPKLEKFSQKNVTTNGYGRWWIVVTPLAVVILCTLALPSILQIPAPEMTVQTRKLLALLIGLMLGLIPLWCTGAPGALKRFLRTLVEPKVLSLLITIGGVIVFKNLLEDSGLLPLAGDRLVASHIPLLWVIILLPFIAGLVTGIAIGFAGIAFPFLAGLVGADTGLTTMATLVLAFASGYAGMMCSPVHLCFVLTRGYFNATTIGILRYVIPLSLFPLATALLLYVLFTHQGW